MQHPDYPFWSALGLILVLLPAPWHWRARNIATISLIGWLTLGNLTLLVNTSVWADNYADPTPVWCDISGYALLAVFQAIPACSLSQMRRLASVTSTSRAVFSTSERTRRIWIEICICVVFPLLMLPLSYIVQGHRYDVLEHLGCSIPSFISWPGLTVRIFVPVVVSIISMIYAGLAIKGFLVRRLQFRSILAKSDSNLTVGRYLRLIALAVADTGILVFNTVVAVIVMFIVNENYRSTPLQPYTSWDDVHHNYAQISQFPAILRTPTSNLGQIIGFYVAPLYSITFFIFFGFGEEAIKEYISVGRRVRGFMVRCGLASRAPADQVQTLNLGSKVIPADEANSVVQYDHTMREGEKFSASLGSNNLGIPVMVERSTV